MVHNGDEIVSPLDVRRPEDKPIQIIDYEFRFIGDKVIISVFPSMGDTVEEHESFWWFKYPRENRTQKIYKSSMLIGVDEVDSTRVYVSPAELVERFKEEQARVKLAKIEQRAKREAADRGETNKQVAPEVIEHVKEG